MCIIVYNETGKPHNEEYLSTSYDNNPHGVGIMWVEDGKVQTLRGLFSKRKMFDILRQFEGIPHALHLRWRTRGEMSKEMCHPFRASAKALDSKVWIMHNGTFMKIKSDAKHSDTYYFARSLRSATSRHGTDILFTETFLRKLESTVESWNKVIFLRDDGKVAIVNPEEWHVEDEIWYSNTYSLVEGYRAKKTAKSRSYGWASFSSSAGSKSSSAVSSSPQSSKGSGSSPKSTVPAVSTKQATATDKDGRTVHTINGIEYKLTEGGFWVRSGNLTKKQAAEETKPRRRFGDSLYAKGKDGIWRRCEDQDSDAAKSAKKTIVPSAPIPNTPEAVAAADWQSVMKDLRPGAGNTSKGKKGSENYKASPTGKKARKQKKRARDERRKAKAKARREENQSLSFSTGSRDARREAREAERAETAAKLPATVVRRRRNADGTVTVTPIRPQLPVELR